MPRSDAGPDAHGYEHEMPTCLPCGAPSELAVCANCALCGELLSPVPGVRMLALRRSTAADRPKVMAAALRAGHLFEDVTVSGEHLAEVLLAWLLENAPTLTWLRYLAEDARWGWTVQPVLAAQEPERTLLRLPEWMSAPGARPQPVLRAYAGLSPARFAAVGYRLGSCGVPASRWEDAVPEGARPEVRLAARSAARAPTETHWRPTRLDRAPRRWPFPRREDGLPLCCGLCGEALPASGPCAWCATSPEDEPPTLAPLGDLFKPRKVCVTCGVDQATGLVPARCPGCGGAAAA